MSRKIVEVRNVKFRLSATTEESRKHPFFLSHVGWCVSVGGHDECIEATIANQVIEKDIKK